jgi:hypothetical protein
VFMWCIMGDSWWCVFLQVFFSSLVFLVLNFQGGKARRDD